MRDGASEGRPLVTLAYECADYLTMNRVKVRRSQVVRMMLRNLGSSWNKATPRRRSYLRTIATNALCQLEAEGVCYSTIIKVSEAKTGSGENKFWFRIGRRRKGVVHK